eukprot:UN11724
MTCLVQVRAEFHVQSCPRKLQLKNRFAHNDASDVKIASKHAF